MIRYSIADLMIGYYLNANVALGHRRLSIIDLSGGHQPISNEDDSIWIVFNGEIFNHKQLRAELEKKGHKYHTHVDRKEELFTLLVFEHWHRRFLPFH